MRQPGEQEARDFIADARFPWYQEFDLVPGVTTPGVNPISWLLDAAAFPHDLRGTSVLDIGTTNGAIAFEAERRGADRVVAVDILDTDYFGFRAIKELFESKAEFVRSDVYELADVIFDTFDIVLAGGRFETNDGLPPTRFADQSFDLVVNHSVFTHLHENYQDQWLEELARITRTDGILVLSFSADLPFAQLEATAAVDAGIAAQRRAELEERGILFLTDDVHLDFPDFYHATYHKPAYVLDRWQRWLELLADIPRNNLEFQDAVVMRARSAS